MARDSNTLISIPERHRTMILSLGAKSEHQKGQGLMRRRHSFAARSTSLRKQAVWLNTTRPDNRVNAARIAHRLAEFFQAFIDHRLRLARDYDTKSDQARRHFATVKEAMCEMHSLLDMMADAVLCERWGGSRTKLSTPVYGFHRSLLGGSAKGMQGLMSDFRMELAEGYDYCHLHDAWFEINVEGSMHLTRVYWRARVVEDPKIMRLALTGAVGVQ